LPGDIENVAPSNAKREVHLMILVSITRSLGFTNASRKVGEPGQVRKRNPEELS
jgi:hypothetical protein